MAIRLVQVGMGNWGRNWATNVIQRSEDVALVACVDLDAEMLVQTQQFLSIPAERCFQTLKSALASVEAEAVLITGSLPAHVPVALEAFMRGSMCYLKSRLRQRSLRRNRWSKWLQTETACWYCQLNFFS